MTLVTDPHYVASLLFAQVIVLRALSYEHVYRVGDRFFAQVTGGTPQEQFPESPTRFFATTAAAQWTYVTNARGEVTELVLQENGLFQPAKKVPASVAIKGAAALRERIGNDVPSPGTEAAVQRWIESEERSQPDYSSMSPMLAVSRRLQAAEVQKIFHNLGELTSLTFLRVNAIGWDIYNATFAHGMAAISIAPLTADGKIYGLTIFAPTAEF